MCTWGQKRWLKRSVPPTDAFSGNTRIHLNRFYLLHVARAIPTAGGCCSDDKWRLRGFWRARCGFSYTYINVQYVIHIYAYLRKSIELLYDNNYYNYYYGYYYCTTKTPQTILAFPFTPLFTYLFRTTNTSWIGYYSSGEVLRVILHSSPSFEKRIYSRQLRVCVRVSVTILGWRRDSAKMQVGRTVKTLIWSWFIFLIAC